MCNLLKDVADLLAYKGPTISELIKEVGSKGKINIKKTFNSYTEVIVIQETAYNLFVKDVYLYNLDNELIKQTLFIDNKKKVVFDKFQEAHKLIEEYEVQSVQQSICC